jgi:hypothetical protein
LKIGNPERKRKKEITIRIKIRSRHLNSLGVGREPGVLTPFLILGGVG